MTAIEDVAAALPVELVDLANGDETAVGFLALADQYVRAPHDEAVKIAGQALRHLAGTPGARLVAWSDLCDAVAMWRSLDLVCDAQGRHSELNLPSFDKANAEVEFCLRQVCGRAVA